jgi:CRISPR-associated endonuclease/helicase Cas3
MEAFLRGENLIIQAPPGAGKTRAAVEPILAAWQQGLDVPNKLIIAAPTRTLVSGTYDKLLKASHGAHWLDSWKPRIQTGERPDDACFEGKIIITTVDQVLASFFTLPYGLPKRLDNLNVAAFMSAYLVFDEFHLYPQNEMMLSVLAMLQLLKGLCRFTLMSATFSQTFIRQMADYLEAKTIMDEPGVPIDQGIFHDVANIQTQRRTWHAHDEALGAERVLALRGRRTMVICNRVARAQALYQAVRQRQPNLKTRLLHAQFYRSDRQAIEGFLGEFEGQEEVILFATQVVEVGLDMSCDVLLTDCAPAASLIQRAGRCARREKQSGQVHVFLPRDEEGRPDFTPYSTDSRELQTVCERTWEALQAPRLQGQIVRSHDEQWLIEQAHADADERFVAHLANTVHQRTREVLDVLANADESARSRFIRAQDTVPVFIHPDPNSDELLTRKPHQRESFGLRRGRLFRYMKALEEAGTEADFYLMACDGEAQDAQQDEDERQGVVYRWHALREVGEIYRGRYVWFVLNPALVQYDARGLLLEAPASEAKAKPSPEVDKAHRESSGYVADTYVQHITGLYLAYMQTRHAYGHLYLALYPDFSYAMQRLCRRTGKDYARVETLMRLIIALHDLGKLNQPWQAWAQAWQRYYPNPTLNDGQALAHTDYDPRQDKALRDGFKHPPRGPHAVESAEAAFAVLYQAAGQDKDLTIAATLAIMHHHTTTAESCGAFAAIADAAAPICAALRACGFDAPEALFAQLKLKFERGQRATPELVKRGKANENSTIAWFYYVFVRTLRLCDQRSSHYIHR